MLLLLLCTACSSASDLPPHEDPADGVVSIAYLKSLLRGTATPLTSNLVITGTVTANDCYGELRERLIVEDKSGAITVAVQGYSLHRSYPIGCRLSIHCTGLTLCNYGGKVELGSGIEEGYTAALDERKQLAHLRIVAEATSWPAPRPITIGALSPALIDCYVRLDGVRFSQSGRWCTTDPETNAPITTEHTLIDEAGNTLTLRVLGSVTYANEPLPEGKGSLYGVIDYFGTRYSLRVVNRGFNF